MALPRAIQAQVEQANATLEALNRPPEPPAPVAEPAQVADPAPDPEPEAAPVPLASTEPQATPQQSDPWEHKYKTLQGLFNREVPTLQHQVKDLKTQLETAVARLNDAADAKAKPAETQKPVADSKDVENFGSDLVEMVQRVAEQMLGSAAQRIEQRIAQLEAAFQGQSQTVAMTAEQAFFDRLTKLAPDWETTNANPDFLSWLAEEDPMLGQRRQSALDAAQQQLNADRAAAVFKTFTGAQPVSAPKPKSLDKQVSPKGTAASAAPVANQPVIWSEKQVVEFYNAKRRGEFRGKEQDAARYEAEINLAISEGRVR